MLRYDMFLCVRAAFFRFLVVIVVGHLLDETITIYLIYRLKLSILNYLIIIIGHHHRIFDVLSSFVDLIGLDRLVCACIVLWHKHNNNNQ